jgi:hypothetical protein
LIREMKDLNISKEDITRARSARLKVNKAPPAPKPAPGRARQGQACWRWRLCRAFARGCGRAFSSSGTVGYRVSRSATARRSSGRQRASERLRVGTPAERSGGRPGALAGGAARS